jgi:hypothetical protein
MRAPEATTNRNWAVGAVPTLAIGAIVAGLTRWRFRAGAHRLELNREAPGGSIVESPLLTMPEHVQN